MLVGVGHQALGSIRNEWLAHHPKTKLPGLCLSVRLHNQCFTRDAPDQYNP
jgi:hypothetical protein